MKRATARKTARTPGRRTASRKAAAGKSLRKITPIRAAVAVRGARGTKKPGPTPKSARAAARVTAPGAAVPAYRPYVTVRPSEVHDVLRRHLLVDGFELVVDLEKSKGVWLHDARTGRKYLDFFSFFATNPVGMNHPMMRTPGFVEKMARIALHNPTNSDVYTVEFAEFVETFGRLAMPESLPHLFLVAGGTLGVENALKAAMDWKVRRNLARGKGEIGHQVIHFRQAFHGRSGYTLSMTNTFDPNKTAYFTRFDWPRIENPKLSFPLTEERLRGVEAAEARAAGQIRDAFRANPDDVCAIILEPIQGEGGDNHFRPEFFRMLRELADEHEALLIFDEVQAGMGLTGRMWAYQHFGVEPDLVAFGKKTQVCGMMAGRRIDEVKDNVFHVASRLNSTWGGNLADMVRCARYLEIIEQERLVENAATVGRHLLHRLEKLAAEFPDRVSNPRGRGLMCAFDAASTEARGRLIAKAYEKGLVAIGCGEKTIRFRPSLTIASDEIDAGIGILREALRTV